MISTLFNDGWYLRGNLDVAIAVRLGLIDAPAHHLGFGRFEGRSPSHLFDPDHYLAYNPDVRAAVEAGSITAYDHFLTFGIAEGRSFVPYFDVDFYLHSNPDVDAAFGGDRGAAVAHFLGHGHTEHRPLSPFFDMGAYLRANPDIASMGGDIGGDPLTHLLFHGYGESRDLGNGIHLDQFANDLTFRLAKTPFEALARVAEVGPFLPSFVPPEGWQAPANTPIPIDFVPLPGEKLVVPPSVKIPDGMELPDTFEPVKPQPGPKPGPGPGPGGPFEAYFDEQAKVVRFKNIQDKQVEFKSIEPDLEDDDDTLVMLLEFQSGGQTSTVRLPMDCGCFEDEFDWDDYEPDVDFDLDDLGEFLSLFPPYVHIELQADETLIAVPELLFPTVVNKVQLIGGSMIWDSDGLVDVKVDMGKGELAAKTTLSLEDTGALVLGHQKDGTEELHLNMKNSLVALMPDADRNLLTYHEGHSGDTRLKSLAIHTAGEVNFVDLGNDEDDDIGYYLRDVDLTGDGLLTLFSLYLDENGTRLDASGHKGSVVLHSYVDTAFQGGLPGHDEWSVRLGDGSDALLLSAIGDGDGKTGGSLDGGGGISLLELDAELYKLWSDADLEGGPEIKNFDILFTEAVNGRSYKSSFLGNDFHTLSIHSDSVPLPSVTVESGFSTVEIGGNMKVDVSALKGDGVAIHIEQGFVSEATITIAALDQEKGDKSDLSGPRKSDMTIVLPNQDDIELGETELETLVVENMTIADSSASPNDAIDFRSWSLEDAEEFLKLAAAFEVTGGDKVKNGEPDIYKNFEIGFDFDCDSVVDFTLVLNNVVTQSEYDEMPDGETKYIELLGILIDEGTFII